MSIGALERLIRRGSSAQPTEVCDLCAAPLTERHRHLLDTQHTEVLCSCQPCSLLFARDVVANDTQHHYRLIPDVRTRLAEFPTNDLGIPVGLAFFVRRTDGTVVAHYPSPVGATQWELDPQVWLDVVEASEPLRHMQPDVEALLVNTARGANEHWLVPIDDCFRLVALVRREWRGWSGGSTVWPLIQEFFDQLGVQASRSALARG